LATASAYSVSQASVSEQKRKPSARRATNDALPAGTNCGRRLAKKTAIFGLPRLLRSPWRSAREGAS